MIIPIWSIEKTRGFRYQKPMLPRGLFPILDENHSNSLPAAEIIEAFLENNISTFIIRNREMSEKNFEKYVQEICLMKNAMDFEFIIHSHVDLAREFDACGVHLTAKSTSITEARKTLGSHKWIGYSAHSLEEVAMAKTEGANYVFLGAIFDTPKIHANHPVLGLKTLSEACQMGIPIYAIGGIHAENLAEIKKTGVHGFSALRALYANGDVEHNASKLNLMWQGSFK